MASWNELVEDAVGVGDEIVGGNRLPLAIDLEAAERDLVGADTTIREIAEARSSQPPCAGSLEGTCAGSLIAAPGGTPITERRPLPGSIRISALNLTPTGPPTIGGPPCGFMLRYHARL